MKFLWEYLPFWKKGQPVPLADQEGDSHDLVALLKRKLTESYQRLHDCEISMAHELTSDAPSFWETGAATLQGHLSSNAGAVISAVSASVILGVLQSQRERQKKDFVRTLGIFAEFHRNKSGSEEIRKNTLTILEQRMREHGMLFEGVSPDIDIKNFKYNEFLDLARSHGVYEQPLSFSQRLLKLGQRITPSLENINHAAQSAQKTSDKVARFIGGTVEELVKVPFHAKDILRDTRQGLTDAFQLVVRYRTLTTIMRNHAEPAAISPLISEKIDAQTQQEIQNIRADIKNHALRAKLSSLSLGMQIVFMTGQTAQLIKNIDEKNLSGVVMNIFAIAAAANPMRVLAVETSRELDIIKSRRAQTAMHVATPSI